MLSGIAQHVSAESAANQALCSYLLLLFALLQRLSCLGQFQLPIHQPRTASAHDAYTWPWCFIVLCSMRENMQTSSAYS